MKPNLFLIRVVLVLTLFFSFNPACLAGEEEGEGETIRVERIKPTGYKPAAPSELGAQGEKLFQELNCMQCHSQHNVGGTMGPALDGIGARRTREFLEAHLTDTPEARSRYRTLVGKEASTWNSHIRLSPAHAERISQYLLTIPEPAEGFIVLPHMTRLPAEPPLETADYKPAVKSAASEEGRKLYFSQGCVACHSISNMGGWIGPRLDGVGGRRSKEYIKAHISNASVHAAQENGGSARSKMPASKLPVGEIEKITDFLLTLPPRSPDR